MVQYGFRFPRKVMANKLSRRFTALLWLVGAGILIGGLVAFEQIALLYFVASIGLIVLLLIVAFADLESVGKDGGGLASQKD